jgi:hypothetical protein
MDAAWVSFPFSFRSCSSFANTLSLLMRVQNARDSHRQAFPPDMPLRRSGSEPGADKVAVLIIL